MKNPYSYNLSYAPDLLRAFDISGSLLELSDPSHLKGTDRDTLQLLKDLERLEKDSKKAYENIASDLRKTTQ